MGRIVAIGGGGLTDIRPLHKHTLGLTAKENPNVLFIPTASRDNEEYIEAFNKSFKELGCEVKTLELVKNKAAIEEADSLLEWADLVYVG